jgi:hypothetical protein
MFGSILVMAGLIINVFGTRWMKNTAVISQDPEN